MTVCQPFQSAFYVIFSCLFCQVGTQENHKLDLKVQATEKKLRDASTQLEEAKKDVAEMRKEAEERIKILDAKGDEINNLKGKIEEGKLQVI